MNHSNNRARLRIYGAWSVALAALTAATTLAVAETVEVADPAASPIAQQVLAAPESARQGETTFYQNCVYCHGSKGSGGKARALQCRDLKPDYLFTTISNGKKRGSLVMPPWKLAMDEKTRWQLVTYIQSLSHLPTCRK